MKTLLIIAGIIAAVIVISVIVVLIIGSRLPQNHVAERSVKLDRSPREIYAVVRDFGNTPAWRPDVKSVEMLEPANGRVRYRENGSNGLVTYELLEEIPNQRLVTQIADLDLGYSGSWTYLFTPDGDGTRVTITENGNVPNPLFRFMSRYIFGHTATMDAYLSALAQRFGETKTIEQAK